MQLLKVTSHLEDISHLLMHYVEKPLPTEKIIINPGICVPHMARVYQVHMYYKYGKAVTYKELLSTEKFKGTAYEDGINLWEVFEDVGDDGHVRYALRGWVYIPASIFPLESAYPSRYTGVSWPKEVEFG